MPQPTIQQTFNLAVQHHRAGRLAPAEQMYRQILARQPNHPETLHWLGVLADQAGRGAVAVDLLARAAALRPNDGDLHSHLGHALWGAGRLDEAIAAYRRAVALKPATALTHYNLGTVLNEQGQWDQAVAAYRRSIALKGDFAEAHCNLGIALSNQGQLDEAAAAYRRAIALKPNFADAYSNLGNLLRDQGQLDEAIAACRQAVALKGDFPEAWSNQGNALNEKGQVDEALAACRQAIALKGDFPEAYCNLGNALIDNAEVDEAIAAYRRAIALRGDLAEAHSNLGQALLLRGEFRQGWQECEWRWRARGFPSPRRNFPQPQWDGQPLQGRTLLLHAEQGLGDSVQFVRYVPLAAQRAVPGAVILECPPELLRLIQSPAHDGSTALTASCQVVERGQPLPAFDLHCPLLSLPRAFATALDTVPHQVPYLFADAQISRYWREKLIEAGDALRQSGRAGEQESSRPGGYRSPVLHVGLVWGGNPRHRNDRNRSIPLSRLAALGGVANVCWVSLQKGPAAAQAQSPPAGLRLLDLSSDLRDMADTAALMANLDLVIGVDTAVVHLAGAMGKPVWTLLPFAPDWRWLRDRWDSPWYPTMRLFRQPVRGGWDAVLAAVVDALSAWAAREKV